MSGEHGLSQFEALESFVELDSRQFLIAFGEFEPQHIECVRWYTRVARDWANGRTSNPHWRWTSTTSGSTAITDSAANFRCIASKFGDWSSQAPGGTARTDRLYSLIRRGQKLSLLVTAKSLTQSRVRILWGAALLLSVS